MKRSDQIEVNVPLPQHWSEAEVKAATLHSTALLHALDALTVKFFDRVSKDMPVENAHWIAMVTLMSSAALHGQVLNGTMDNFLRLATEVYGRDKDEATLQ
jgi:hypothetical protein